MIDQRPSDWPPLVSINIPTTASSRICECIDSILARTFDDLEVTVIDDAAADDYRDYVASLADPRIRQPQRQATGRDEEHLSSDLRPAMEPVAWYRGHGENDDRHEDITSAEILELLKTCRAALPERMHVRDESLFFPVCG